MKNNNTNLIYRVVTSTSKDMNTALQCSSDVCEYVSEAWALTHFSFIAAGIDAGNYQLLKHTDTCTVVRHTPTKTATLYYYIILELVN